MRLFHGSDVPVRSVDLGRALMFKDFGPGFYLSADIKQAKAFARYKADRPRSITHTAVVSVFEFDESHLTDGRLRVKRFEGYSAEWIDFIHTYRTSNDTDYDVVIGPIANDDVRTSFAQYEMGEMTREELLDALKFKRVTYQYCFKTETAVSFLKWVQ